MRLMSERSPISPWSLRFRRRDADLRGGLGVLPASVRSVADLSVPMVVVSLCIGKAIFTRTLD